METTGMGVANVPSIVPVTFNDNVPQICLVILVDSL